VSGTLGRGTSSDFPFVRIWAFLMGALLATLWLGMVLRERDAQAARVLALLGEVDRQQSISTNHDIILEQQKYAGEKLIEDQRRFPARLAMETIQAELGEFSDRCGLQSTTVDPGSENVREFFAGITLNLSTSTSSGSLLCLVESLSSQGLSKDIRSLEVTTQDSDTGQVDARLQVRYYRYVEQEDADE
jgi:Tfp pilus assembly protein PilO